MYCRVNNYFIKIKIKRIIITWAVVRNAEGIDGIGHVTVPEITAIINVRFVLNRWLDLILWELDGMMLHRAFATYWRLLLQALDSYRERRNSRLRGGAAVVRPGSGMDGQLLPHAVEQFEDPLDPRAHEGSSADEAGW